MDGQPGTTTPESRRLAAIELASRSAATFRRTARRYSLCSDDAEDAYQRSLEILLTKAPTDDLRQLRPWLQTVVKHEALAVRAQRERMLGAEPESEGADLAPGPDERAPQRERARQTAEALGQLKRSELQCMLLKALGYSYDEIAERTGYSWTKVNRSLTEGRKSFFDRYDQIASGASCERLAPALAAAAAGGIEPGAGGELLTHIQGCASCRANLAARRRRSAAGVELLSPAMILPALRGSWWSRAQDAVTGSLIDRVALAAAKLQQLAEAATVHKTAAVVASTAALAGGAAVERRADLDRTKSAKPEIAQRSHSQRSTALASSRAPSRDRVARPEPEPEPEPQPAAKAERAPPATVATPDSAGEFAPAPAISQSQQPTAPASAPAPTDSPEPTTDEEFMP